MVLCSSTTAEKGRKAQIWREHREWTVLTTINTVHSGCTNKSTWITLLFSTYGISGQMSRHFLDGLLYTVKSYCSRIKCLDLHISDAGWRLRRCFHGNGSAPGCNAGEQPHQQLLQHRLPPPPLLTRVEWLADDYDTCATNGPQDCVRADRRATAVSRRHRRRCRLMWLTSRADGWHAVALLSWHDDTGRRMKADTASTCMMQFFCRRQNIA